VVFAGGTVVRSRRSVPRRPSRSLKGRASCCARSSTTTTCRSRASSSAASPTRQLVSRARKRLGADRPRFDADERARDRLLERFLAAAEEGDLDALESLLADDAVFYSDGGGKVAAARKPLVGAPRIARVIAAITRKELSRRRLASPLARVNGQPGRIPREPDGTVWSVLTIDVVDERIQTVRVMRNPTSSRTSERSSCHTASGRCVVEGGSTGGTGGTRGAPATPQRGSIASTPGAEPLYSERKRAALGLCEAISLVAETRVPAAVWERAGFAASGRRAAPLSRSPSRQR
jgi:hypothetical protein